MSLPSVNDARTLANLGLVDSHNVTLDPDKPASAASRLEISKVRDFESGIVHDAREWIESRRYDDLIDKRVRAREASVDPARVPPVVTCPECEVRLQIVAHPDKTFFFRHCSEDGRCSARTRNGESFEAFRAKLYDGRQESPWHKEIKARVLRSLQADGQVEGAVAEQRVTSSANSRDYRIPDVQGHYKGQSIAFEVQRSSTLLDVVARRRLFYREQGWILIWVLGRFFPEYRTISSDEHLFMNNHNVLVMDEETVAMSEQEGRCIVRAHFRKAELQGQQIVESWGERIVGLDELTFDKEGMRAYWHDFAGERGKCEERFRRRDVPAEVLRFYEDSKAYFSDRRLQWAELVKLGRVDGIELPDSAGDGDFRAAVRALMSARAGKPKGFDFVRLIQVAHYLADSHKNLLTLFFRVLKANGHEALILSQDRKGLWEAKAATIRAQIKAKAKGYEQTSKWGPTLAKLFPELAL